MSNHETSQAAQDERVVGATLAEIDGYATQADFQTAHAEAARFIGGLYDEFVPRVNDAARSKGVALGAVGLALAEARYGRDEHSPKLYGGSYESNVLATYHHGAHPRRFMRGTFQYAAAANELRPGTYDDAAFGQFPGIAALHDIIMGNGRGHDERQSGLLAARLLPRFGFTPAEVESTVAGIDATTWCDERQAQAVDPAKTHLNYQRAAAVGDLLAPFTRSGMYEAVCLFVEDMCKRGHDQILVHEARARGFALGKVGVAECVEFIDGSERLRAKFGRLLLGQAAFFETFKPADPELDDLFPGRAANVAFAIECGEAFVRGGTARTTLAEAQSFMTAA